MITKDDIRKLITNHYRRLQRLKEQEALHGLSVDPGVLIEIEDIEIKIAELQEALIAPDDWPEEASLQSSQTSSAIQKNVETSPQLNPIDRKLTLPRPNPALQNLRRWLIGK